MTPLPEPPTLRLNTAHVTLFQSLGDAAGRQACFVLYSGPDAGRRYTLDAAQLVIGRAPECGIHLDSPGISRRHAELCSAGDSVVLRDLGSSNGTLVNDKRLDGAAALHDGDLVRLGNLVLRYYDRHSLDALLHDRLYRMATIDAGTEVYTKRYLLEALAREFRLADRHDHPLSLVCLDLDHFKAVNDLYGHNGGDTVLREAAAVVQGLVRGTDIVGRMGGEEFVIVLPDTRLQRAAELAERIRSGLAGHRIALDPVDTAGTGPRHHQQTASFGVAQRGPQTPDVRALLGAADACLYAAKNGGRNRVSC